MGCACKEKKEELDRLREEKQRLEALLEKMRSKIASLNQKLSAYQNG